jgi:hypothetical protein
MKLQNIYEISQAMRQCGVWSIARACFKCGLPIDHVLMALRVHD